MTVALGCAQPATAQVPGLPAQRVVFKLHPAYAYACQPHSIGIDGMQALLTSLRPTRLVQKHPQAPSPADHLCKGSMPWVQLATIYELEYTANLTPALAAARLAQHPAVSYAEAAPAPQLLYTPTDTDWFHQDNVRKVAADLAWDVQPGDTNVVIAITDDGVFWNHPDLIDNIAYNRADPIDGLDNDADGYTDNYRGWDFVGPSWPPLPDNNTAPPNTIARHGTWVAGYAGATADNNMGLAGVGFKCRILPLKTGPDNASSIYLGYEAVKYAADHGASVINCSWGNKTFSHYGNDIIQYAINTRGAVVVAAAGNDNNENLFYPASYDGVISVAATLISDQKGSVSSFGPRITVCAPGYGRSLNYPSGYTGFGSTPFTSFAAPHVSGVVGLVRSQFPSYTPQQVVAQISNTADSIDALNSPSLHEKLGAGRVNAYKAVTLNAPALRLHNVQVLSSAGRPAVAADTALLTATVINHLQAATNTSITLRVADAYVTLLDSVLLLGHMASGASINTSSTPLRMLLAPNTPANHVLWLRVACQADGYARHHHVRLVVNQAFAVLDNGQLRTALMHQGNVGYADFPTNQHGLGFAPTNTGTSYLYEGGLLLGRSSSQVASNIRNTSTADAHFVASQPIAQPSMPRYAHTEALAQFTDAAAGAASMGLSIRQEAFGFAADSLNDFILLRYTVHNTTDSTLTNLHLGQYADWDVSVNGWRDSTWYLSPQRMLVTTSDTAQPQKVSVALLALAHDSLVRGAALQGGVFAYTIANKYTALSNGGTPSVLASDAAQLLAAGPFTLAAGDSLQMGYALLLGRSTAALTTSAAQAHMAYDCLLTATPFRISLGADTTVCAQHTLAPTGAGIVAYHWSTGATTPTLTLDSTGSYALRAFNAKGCIDYKAIHVTVAPNIVPRTYIADTLLTLSLGQQLVVRDSSLGATAWLWDFGDGSLHSGPHATHNYLLPGRYTLTLTLANAACTTSTQQTITVRANKSSVDASLDANTWHVYPNPAAGFITLHRPPQALGLISVQFFDTNGRNVLTINKESSDWLDDLTLPLGLPAGLYSLHIRHADQLITHKIIVQ